MWQFLLCVQAETYAFAAGIVMSAGVGILTTLALTAVRPPSVFFGALCQVLSAAGLFTASTSLSQLRSELNQPTPSARAAHFATLLHTHPERTVIARYALTTACVAFVASLLLLTWALPTAARK